MTDYELSFLHIVFCNDITFAKHRLRGVIEIGWALQLSQYISLFLEKVHSRRTP